MWRIRYTLQGRPTIAITDATGHTLIVRRLVRERRHRARVDHIMFTISRGHRVRVARSSCTAMYGKENPAGPDIAMWVTSNGCVDEAPHEGWS
jgi:hypothetical protein